MQPGASRVIHAAARKLFVAAAFAAAALAHADELTTPLNDAIAGAVLDCGSTVIAMKGYGAIERNPIGKLPAGIAIACGGKAIAIYVADHQDEPERTRTLTAWGAMQSAAGLRNLTLLGGLALVKTGVIAAVNLAPIGWAVFAATGAYVWFSRADEREFAQVCAALRKANPALTCEFEKHDPATGPETVVHNK